MEIICINQKPFPLAQILRMCGETSYGFVLSHICVSPLQSYMIHTNLHDYLSYSSICFPTDRWREYTWRKYCGRWRSQNGVQGNLLGLLNLLSEHFRYFLLVVGEKKSR